MSALIRCTTPTAGGSVTNGAVRCKWKVVEYAHIDKAYAEGKTTVVLTKEDLKSFPEEWSKEIEVVEFVPSEQIDPIMFDRYFYGAGEAGYQQYALLSSFWRRPTHSDRAVLAAPEDPA